MKKTCSRCGFSEEVERPEVRPTKHFRHGRNYESHYTFYSPLGGGRKWRDNLCGDCLRGIQRKTKGTVPRCISKIPSVKKAVDAEVAAQKFFEELGFFVKRTECFGPDLICQMGPLSWTVEVKSSVANRVKGKNYWITGKVSRKRKADDLVAIVLPGGRVYLDSMQGHLEACNRGGCRTITPLLAFDKFNV